MEGNGRVYTIQLCARDEAGNRSCVERHIKVPTWIQSRFSKSDLEGEYLPVVDDGKLYVLAKDEVVEFGAL